MRHVLNEEGCGILINDQSVESIIKAIEKLLNNNDNLLKMSKNGQRAIRKRYSWEIMEKRMIARYAQLEKNDNT